MTRRFLVALAMFGVTAAPGAAHAQQGAFRFEISAVGDSTINFHVADASWVKPGMSGIAVDPSKHDQLVARIKVLRVSGSLATAVVTGQTTRITTDFVALLEPPGKHWYQQPAVWIGTGLGIVLGVVIAR